MTASTSGGRLGTSHGTRRLVTAVAVASLGFGLAPAPSAATAVAGAASAQVRVNQLGYAPLAGKRAYLMAPAAEAGAIFRVVNAHEQVVFAAPVGASQGSWSTAYPFVYALDFNTLTRTGTFHITVAGRFPASSPRFRIAAPDDLYASALRNALSFYQNERDGAGFIASPLRSAPGHLNDATAMAYLTPKVDGNGNFAGDLTPIGVTLDASGGWWDAGDYLKFVETTSYVVAVLGIGARDFPGQMGRDATSSNFVAEVKFGTDFLQRMWNDTTRTLYYQVGIGAGNFSGSILSDHDIWRLPQVDDNYLGHDPKFKYIRNRPVFIAGPPNSLISPNQAGRLAADMAECFQLFKRTNPAYADKCLISGEHIFDLANPNPGQLLTGIPFGFYGETEWRDDLELGATELSSALAGGDLPAGLPHRDPGYYLKKAAFWANAYITGPNDAKDTLNLYDVSGLAHYELFRAIQRAGNPTDLGVTPSSLLADLKKGLDRGLALAATDPFGFGFPWGTYDTTTHGAGLAVMAAEYDKLTGSQTYAAYGTRWLANILGANAWGTSLIVGDGSTFPNCMQHQVTNIIGSRNGEPPLLRGAAVEGPNSFAATGSLPHMRVCPVNGIDTYAQFNGTTAVFQDNVQSYSTVEPAIDLTASSPLAFSWQIDAG